MEHKIHQPEPRIQIELSKKEVAALAYLLATPYTFLGKRIAKTIFPDIFSDALEIAEIGNDIAEKLIQIHDRKMTYPVIVGCIAHGGPDCICESGTDK